MEFVDLAWIALIVFYFLLRSLGGNKRKRQTRSPQPAGQPTSRPASRNDDALSVALGEIRRSLGIPGQEPEASPRMDTADARQTPSEPNPPPKTSLPPRQPRSKDRPRVSKPSRRRSVPDDTSRRSKRPRHGHSRSKTIAGLPGGSQPAVGDAIVPDMPTLRSSFSEEEAFEKVGRHPHRETHHNLQVVNPYEASRKKHLPGVRRALNTRSSLRTSFLLKEILDRPVSMRRR